MRIESGQSIADIALQATGVVTSMWAIAKENGLVINAMVKGDVVIPECDDVDTPVVGYYAAHGIMPCTGISGSDMGGIGAMGIEIDFCVE